MRKGTCQDSCVSRIYLKLSTLNRCWHCKNLDILSRSPLKRLFLSRWALYHRSLAPLPNFEREQFLKRKQSHNILSMRHLEDSHVLQTLDTKWIPFPSHLSSNGALMLPYPNFEGKPWPPATLQTPLFWLRLAESCPLRLGGRKAKQAWKEFVAGGGGPITPTHLWLNFPPHPQRMEVPWPGIESRQHLQPTPQLWQ